MAYTVSLPTLERSRSLTAPFQPPDNCPPVSPRVFLSDIVAQCLAAQLVEVFASLDEQERSDTLRLFAQEIGNRYNRVTADAFVEPATAFGNTAGAP